MSVSIYMLQGAVGIWQHQRNWLRSYPRSIRWLTSCWPSFTYSHLTSALVRTTTFLRLLLVAITWRWYPSRLFKHVEVIVNKRHLREKRASWINKKSRCGECCTNPICANAHLFVLKKYLIRSRVRVYCGHESTVLACPCHSWLEAWEKSVRVGRKEIILSGSNCARVVLVRRGH